MDYMISPLFNCFSGDTEIITDRGVKTFRKLGENRIVNVLTKDGEFSPAIVKKYGKQKLNTVTMTSGRTTRKVRVTANHRWVLKDGRDRKSTRLNSSHR